MLMYITAEKETEWTIKSSKDVEVLEGQEMTHYILGEIPKFEGPEGIKSLIYAAAGSAYGYTALSVYKEGRLFVTTDILGAIPVYVVEKSGRVVVTTDYPTALKYGKPKILKNARIFDIEGGKEFRYYDFVTDDLTLLESDIEKELNSYLYGEVGGRKVAIAFSGGLDSAILAKITSNFSSPHLFTLGLKGSHDIDLSGVVADKMGISWTPLEISEREVQEAIKTIINLVPLSTLMDVSLAVGFYILGKRLMKFGFKKVILGQLADELFAGYKKYERVPIYKLNKVLLNDVERSYLGLARDYSSFSVSGIKIIVPYSRKRLVNLALKASPNFKIRNGERKYILRKLAQKLKLPEEVIKGRKKAFQYGSGIDKVVRRWVKNHRASFGPYFP